jgi:hypothetical protein
MWSFGGFGPPIGQANLPSRSDSFIRQCASPLKVSDDEVRDLRNSMSCVQCHDGKKANAMSFPLGLFETETLNDPGLGQSTLEIMIKSGHMPPGNPFPKGDRRGQSLRDALYNCLMTEYYGEFADLNGRGLLLQSLEPACPVAESGGAATGNGTSARPPR